MDQNLTTFSKFITDSTESDKYDQSFFIDKNKWIKYNIFIIIIIIEFFKIEKNK